MLWHLLCLYTLAYTILNQCTLDLVALLVTDPLSVNSQPFLNFPLFKYQLNIAVPFEPMMQLKNLISICLVITEGNVSSKFHFPSLNHVGMVAFPDCFKIKPYSVDGVCRTAPSTQCMLNTSIDLIVAETVDSPFPLINLLFTDQATPFL